jgi:hypothetical protein
MGDRIKWFQSAIALGSPHYHHHWAQARHSCPNKKNKIQNIVFQMYDHVVVATLPPADTGMPQSSKIWIIFQNIEILPDYQYWETQVVPI